MANAQAQEVTGQLTLDVVTPEKLLSSRSVYMAVLPGSEGYMGVLSGHSPLLSTLKPGVISIYSSPDKVEERLFVKGGFVEISNNRCTVLATEAQDTTTIDAAEAKEKLNEALYAYDKAQTGEEKARADENINAARALVEATEK